MAAAAKPIYAAQAGTDYSIASLLINCPTRDVRFTPKSGHCIAPQRMSALCQKQTSGAQATRSGRLNISSKLCVCHLDSVWRGQSKERGRPHHREQSRQSAISRPAESRSSARPTDIEGKPWATARHQRTTYPKHRSGL